MTPESDTKDRLAQAKARHMQGDIAAAEAVYRAILAEAPTHFEATHLLGLAAFQRGDLPRATTLLERATTLDPGSAKAHSNLGNALRAAERLEAALESYDRAVALDPALHPAQYNRACCLVSLDRMAEAEAGFGAALALEPADVEALVNHASALNALGRRAAALAQAERALALRPGQPGALLLCALLAPERYRPAEVLAGFDRALAADPASPHALLGRADALRELDRPEEAAAAYAEVLRHAPDTKNALGDLVLTRLATCDWSDLAEARARMEAGLLAGRPVAPAFATLVASTSRPVQRAAARLALSGLPMAAPPPMPEHADGRLRIGYFSADMHGHPSSVLMAGVLEAHDRSRVEVVVFSFGPDREDAMRRRLRAGADRFLDVRARTDEEIAALSRDLGIQVAVDLMGGTRGTRPGILAAGAAPVQAAWLGYPGAWGAPFLHYTLADAVVVPEAHRADYDEAIVRLPFSYQSNDATRPLPGPVPPRAALGLPPDGTVFCCFNNVQKILPETFALWMRILRAVEGSVLWLLTSNPAAIRNLRAEAARAGLDPARLVFAPRAHLADHMTRHGPADLFLDTLPYNAHTTTSDALWAGLPVLTLAGETFAGRVAASLLTAAGLPELITETPDAYVARAVALAGAPEELRALRARVVAARTESPLFDARRFAGHLEAAYAAMVDRHRAGLPPADIAVPP